MILEPFQVALSVADALERCGVPYVVEEYLRDGAHLLDVTDLLDRALQARS